MGNVFDNIRYFIAEGIRKTLGGVPPLPHQGRKAEDDQSQCACVFQRFPDGSKSVESQYCCRMAGVLHISDADYKSRNAANDNGIKKDFSNPRNSFIDGMRYNRAAMSKGSGPFPSFIGVHAAGNPVLHGLAIT